MHRFVTTGGPAGSLLHPQGVVGTTDHELTVAHRLEMAFQARVRVANCQQFVIDGTMRLVTTGAPFAQRLMLERERTTLRGVTAEATLIFREDGCATADVTGSFVRRVATTAI